MGDPKPERTGVDIDVETHRGRLRRRRHGCCVRLPATASGNAAHIAERDRECGDCERQHRRCVCLGKRSGGEQVVDVDRQAVGVVGEDHDGAVLTKGPQPHEDHPCADPVRRRRHIDAQEAGQRPVTERGRHLPQRRIDGPEGTACHNHQEWDRDK